MNKLKLIIFDYDGVIVDSFPTVHLVYKKICAEIGVKWPEDIKKFKKLYGYNYHNLLHNLGVDINQVKEKQEQLFKAEIVKQRPKLQQGIGGSIKKLSLKYELILATSNYEHEARQKLSDYNLLKFFTKLLAKDPKTEPQHFKFKQTVINEFLKQHSLGRNEVVFIGDRDVDYDVSKELGISNFIFAAYGGWPYNPSRIPDNTLMAKNPADILGVVQKIEEPA